VDVIYHASSEAEVISWMSAHKVPRSEIAHRHKEDGASALLLAVRKRMHAVTKSLLQVQVPVNDANDVGDTPLHWACWRSRDVPEMVTTVELLLLAGADTNVVGDLGNTPLHLAATANCVMVCPAACSAHVAASALCVIHTAARYPPSCEWLSCKDLLRH
jgi:hypothetical protein